jgi:hypothetical protein
LTMMERVVGTSKRKGRKGKERKDARRGEPHSGGMGEKRVRAV